jgi:predicted dehydrogenase
MAGNQKRVNTETPAILGALGIWTLSLMLSGIAPKALAGTPQAGQATRAPSVSTPEENAPGWRSLFTGRDLANWRSVGSGAGRRIGIIGLDTSHAPAFTRAFNAPDASVDDFGGFRVVAAYPQGSRDIDSSTSRVPEYVREMRGLGVEIVDSIAALLTKVDFVLLTSNDGRVHLAQARPVIEAGKPLYIDKPMAASLPDVIALFEEARAKNVPLFSASSLRWIPGALDLRNGAQGPVRGADAFSWAALEPTHPDLYWYGIHGVEILFTVMGAGCRSVSRFRTEDTEFCVGQWERGRIGTFRGLRSSEHSYGGTVFAEKKIEYLPMGSDYGPMLKAIAQFFATGRPPVSPDETIEIYAFMTAADRSKAQGGRPVLISEVLTEARAEAAKRGH